MATLPPVATAASGEGDPLVLVHGVGASGAVWRRVVDPLARTRRVVAIDLPGFGGSQPAGPGFELDEVARRVADSAAAEAGGPFDLLGHSLGGAVAVTLADRRPDLVRSLVLLSPAGFDPRAPAVAAGIGAAAAGLLAARRLISRPLVASATARRALLWGAVVDGSRMPAADARLMIESSAQATRVRQAIAAVVAADLTERFAGLPAPVAMLWGERDRIVRNTTAARLREARREAPVAVIPRTGHVPQLERPRAFAAALDRLLERMGSVQAAAPGGHVTG